MPLSFSSMTLVSFHATSCPNFLAPRVLFLVSQCRKLFPNTRLLNISFFLLLPGITIFPIIYQTLLKSVQFSHTVVSDSLQPHGLRNPMVSHRQDLENSMDYIAHGVTNPL